jgi:hypothetical protein
VLMLWMNEVKEAVVREGSKTTLTELTPSFPPTECKPNQARATVGV